MVLLGLTTKKRYSGGLLGGVLRGDGQVYGYQAPRASVLGVFHIGLRVWG